MSFDGVTLCVLSPVMVPQQGSHHKMTPLLQVVALKLALALELYAEISCCVFYVFEPVHLPVGSVQ